MVFCRLLHHYGGVRSNTSNKLLKIILSIITVVVVLLLVVEFGLRWFIGNQLANSMEATEGDEKASISFGAQPLLWGIATQNLNNVEIKTPNSVTITYPNSSEVPEVAGTPETTITMSNLDMSDPNSPVAGHMTMHTLATDEFLLATIQREMANAQENSQPQQPQGNPFEGGELNLEELAGGFLQNLIKITGISSNAASGTVDIQITNGAAALTLRPEVTNGQMGFVAENASLFGFDLPEGVSDALTKALSEGMGDTAGTGMTITNVAVVDGGVDLTMEGENVKLSELQQSATPQSPALPAEESATANS